MMNNRVNQSEGVTFCTRLIARVWSAVVICVGLLAMLNNTFEAATRLQTSAAWYDYLIPAAVFLSVLGLVLAWRWELLGGVLSVGFAVLSLALYLVTGAAQTAAAVILLAALATPGVLSLMCWWRSHRLMAA